MPEWDGGDITRACSSPTNNGKECARSSVSSTDCHPPGPASCMGRGEPRPQEITRAAARTARPTRLGWMVPAVTTAGSRETCTTSTISDVLSAIPPDASGRTGRSTFLASGPGQEAGASMSSPSVTSATSSRPGQVRSHRGIPDRVTSRSTAAPPVTESRRKRSHPAPSPSAAARRPLGRRRGEDQRRRRCAPTDRTPGGGRPVPATCDEWAADWSASSWLPPTAAPRDPPTGLAEHE